MVCELGSRVCYHQTDQSGATGIRESGVRCSSSGAYGAAAYFAASAEETNSKARHTGWIVKCRVDLGTALICGESTPSLFQGLLAALGCDSVCAPTGPGGGASEFAVFDSSRITVIDIYRR